MKTVPNLSDLSLDQKIGQMFMARDHKVNGPEVLELLSEGRIGAIISNRNLSVEEIEKYQEISPFPLLIAADMETGCIAVPPRVPTPMPSQMAMGAFATEREVYCWAKIIAREARASGVNHILGPVLDLALSPESTCVNTRSFGDDLARTTALASAAVQGFQDHGMLVALKHFPGFGASPLDAHIQMCVLDQPVETFRARELECYRRLVQGAGVNGIMTGHIRVPALDPEQSATTSKTLVQWLRDQGFDGVLMTDSLAMKGLKLKMAHEDSYPLAMAAGHDLILTDYSFPPREALRCMHSAVTRGLITEAQIDRSVARLLQAKRQILSFQPEPFDCAGHERISRDFSRRSITLLGEKPRIDPAKKTLILISQEGSKQVDRNEVLMIQGERGALAQRLQQFIPQATWRQISDYPDAGTIQEVLEQAIACEQIIVVAYAEFGAYRGTGHLSRPVVHLINGLRHKTAALVCFGSPHAVAELEPPRCVIFGYVGGFRESAAAEVLLGRQAATGKLPVTLKWKNWHAV